MPRAASSAKNSAGELSEAKPARKTKSSGGLGGKKKLTAFNKFMQTEMARLKEDEPDMTHKDRFKTATANWKTAKENPGKAP